MSLFSAGHLSELQDRTDDFLEELRQSPPTKQARLAWNLPCAVIMDQEEKPKEFEKWKEKHLNIYRLLFLVFVIRAFNMRSTL